jgi:hypothetical protein
MASLSERRIQTSRPGDPNKPTDVKFYIYVIDVGDIDDVKQTFAANVFIALSWNDPRLAHEGDPVTVPLDKIWNPSPMIANLGRFVRPSLPEVARVFPDGRVVYRQRYLGDISQPLTLSEFPFDEHRFAVHAVAVGYSPEQVRFLPGSPRPGEIPDTGGGIAETLSLQDWEIVEYKARALPLKPLPGSEVAGFVFEFTAERHKLYYICQVIVPLILIIMMSWVAFYVDPTNAGVQVGVATSTILTLIAYRFMLGNLLPRLPYMTRLDYFTLGSTVLVFVTLAEVLITTTLARNEQVDMARRIDRWSRKVFPAVFAVLFVWALIF